MWFKYTPRHSRRTDWWTKRWIRLRIFTLHLLTLYLTLSSSHFLASSPSRLRQHFCPSMNIWMRLKLPIPTRTRTHAHIRTPISPVSSHKHFIDSISSQVRQSADFLNFRRGWILDGREILGFLQLWSMQKGGRGRICKEIKQWKQRNQAGDAVRPAVEGHPAWLLAWNQPKAATSTSK